MRGPRVHQGVEAFRGRAVAWGRSPGHDRTMSCGVRPFVRVLVWGLLTLVGPAAWSRSEPPAELLLNDDGGWCWFQDERALVVGDRLVVGSVASGHRDAARKGDVDVVSLDLRQGGVTRLALRKGLGLDDHNAPAFVGLRDGRILAMYAKHGTENRLYQRRSLAPGDATAWSREEVIVPSESSRVTYSNLHRLAAEGGRAGRLYQFFRGLDASFKPSWIFSDDEGRSWQRGGVLISVPEGSVQHRPYVKYASDGRRTVHFAFTEAHPRDFDNGIYHAMLVGDRFERVGGALIHRLSEGPLSPTNAVPVQPGTPDRVCWIQDLELDARGRPRMVYSIQVGSQGLPAGRGGDDLRYGFAEWDGHAWWTAEIARAGRRLYAGEDDYAGGIALHPDDPRTVVISTSVNPESGEPLPGGHYELFKGRRTSSRPGAAWAWEALTPGAQEDQLRPVIPRWRSGRTVLLWLRGGYRSYTDYNLAVVARIEGGRR